VYLVRFFSPVKLSPMFLFLALLVSTNCGYSYRLGMLGEVPDWSLLDKYQKTMSREEFVEALETVYLPYGVDDKWITIFPGYALIRTNSDESSANYRVDFAPWGHEENESDKLEGESPETGELPLQGLVIAVDPGHIGGNYSAMERRHFQIGQDAPVKEGDLTLQVSRKGTRASDSKPTIRFFGGIQPY
jgi:N-acetylmuramoyl-L-alanine amidase